MRHFNHQNTQEFTDEQLEQMNNEFEWMMRLVSKEHPNYENIVKEAEKIIIDKY